MRVFIEETIFSNEPVWGLPLFWFGCVHRHRIRVPRAARQAFSAWRQTLGPKSLQDAVDHALAWSDSEEASNPSFFQVTVSATTPAGAAVAPEVAWALLQRPYRLLLEDGVNDREFFLRMCGAPERAFLRDRMEKEWLEADHGGGITSMPRRVTELRERSGPFLASCLFDSDAGSPGTPSSASTKLERTCANAGMHHYQLKRRAIENYLPRSALERWVTQGQDRRQQTERRDLVKMLFEKGGVQRHHENLKETLGDSKVGHLFGDESAMREADVIGEGGPAELATFVRELIERVR